jgi:hypothetical protein
MVAAEGSDSPDNGNADGKGACSGRGLAPSRISASSHPKLSRARLMMTVVSCSLVVTGLANTSRAASGTASYASIHDESARDRGVRGAEIAVIHSENSSSDK